jgi:hypothetical protein
VRHPQALGQQELQLVAETLAPMAQVASLVREVMLEKLRSWWTGDGLDRKVDVETDRGPCVDEFSDRQTVIFSGQLYILQFTLDLKFFCYSQGRGLRFLILQSELTCRRRSLQPREKGLV